MENNQKRNLLNMSYYALIIGAILFSVVFFLRTTFSTLPIIIQIIYYVWTIALVLNLLFDVYCTMKHRMKYFSGLIFLILGVLCSIMAIVVFFVQGISLEIIGTNEITYFINIALSISPVVLGIYAYIFGEKIINFND
ncbi:MAG: hypothetical protein E7359_00105 [Clostridiales bacterium]|nr:hypothetical protein [Clostridiales bacterium]